MPDVSCPQCQARLDAPEHLLGTQVTCSQCGHVFVAQPDSSVPMPAPPPPYPPGAQRTSGYAVASLVLGIVAIPGCLCYGLPAIICGILAIVFFKHAARAVAAGEAGPSSLGIAKAGKICGTVGVVLGVLGILFMIGYFIFVFYFMSRFQPASTPAMFPPP